eukprot:351937-Chlamydomonas_euryale.AAC.18
MSSSSAPPIDCAVLDDSTDPDNRPVVLPQAQSAPPAPGMSSMRAGMPSRRSVAALPSNVELNKSSAVMSAAARPPPVAAEQPENSAASSTTASQRSTIPPPPRAAAPSPVQPDSCSNGEGQAPAGKRVRRRAEIGKQRGEKGRTDREDGGAKGRMEA